MADEPRARRLAADLLEIGAVHLSPEAPFTWASGLKAPLYCDNRLTLAFPAVRRGIAEGFAEILAAQHMQPDVIVGTATAGIPHAAWLAERLDLPLAYGRSKPKEHGRGNQVEGRVEMGHTVVIVEDLISTGGSSLNVVKVVRGAGAEVAALLAIFSYGLEVARSRFAEALLPVFTLTDFETLLSVAREQDRIAAADVEELRDWQRDPQAWSERWQG